MDPKTRKIALSMKKRMGDAIVDFKLIGENQDKLVSVTVHGHVLLYNLGLKSHKKRGIVAKFRIDVLEEECQSLAVCEKNQYVIVEVGDVMSLFCSKMLILQVDEDSISKLAEIDEYSKSIREKYAQEWIGYAEKEALWVGLSGEEGPVQVYAYNTESGDFREIEDERVSHQERRVFKLHRMGGKLYYTGMGARLMRLSWSY